MPVSTDGWVLTLFNDCDTTASTAGRLMAESARLDWQRDGADPVELLSVWEREQLERLLARL